MIEGSLLWLAEEEIYLQDLSKLCQTLCGKYKVYYELYKRQQAGFKIPSIIISSVTGLTSFGSSNFPAQYSQWIAISVGVASLFIALLNSIEAYLNISGIMSGCLIASMELQKLKEHIDMELNIPSNHRAIQGAIFLRDCYTRYERILDISPTVIKTTRFIKPSFNDKIPTSITISRQLDTDVADTKKNAPPSHSPVPSQNIVKTPTSASEPV